MKHNTYIVDKVADEAANQRLRAALHSEDQDTSWADHLPPDTLPEDEGDVVAEFFPPAKPPSGV